MKIESSEIVETNDYRIIIYPANRPFTPKESKEITENLYDFLGGWQSHGKDISASFKIERNQFIIIVIDEENVKATGCSRGELDKIMHDIDNKYQLGLFDRMKASFLENDKIITLKLNEFRKQIKEGNLSKDISVFDFSKDTYLEFLSGFLLPFKESWAGRLA